MARGASVRRPWLLIAVLLGALEPWALANPPAPMPSLRVNRTAGGNSTGKPVWVAPADAEESFDPMRRAHRRQNFFW